LVVQLDKETDKAEWAPIEAKMRETLPSLRLFGLQRIQNK